MLSAEPLQVVFLLANLSAMLIQSPGLVLRTPLVQIEEALLLLELGELIALLVHQAEESLVRRPRCGHLLLKVLEVFVAELLALL